MTTDSRSACAPSLFVGAVGLTTLSAASLASRRALKRAVLARSAFRSAIYSAMAWAPSVTRSDFLNCVSAHLRSFESSVNVWLLFALGHQLIVLQGGCAVVPNSRTEIACSWSCCIDGFHRSSRPSRSSGPRPSCVGIELASVGTGVGNPALLEADRRSPSCAR